MAVVSAPDPFRGRRDHVRKGGRGREGKEYDAPSAAIGMQAVAVLSRCEPAD